MLKVNEGFIDGVMAKVKITERGRINYNLHRDYADRIQHLFNISNKNSYVRPHKHENPDKLEIFVILRGRILVLEFDDSGKVKDYIILDNKKGNFAVEVPARAWHSFISLQDKSCLFEIKEGPYSPDIDKKFPDWAPEEGSKEAQLFNQKILSELGIRRKKNV